MYGKIRAIHRCTGLFCLAFLAMYAISGVQMAHRRWFPLSERAAEQIYSLAPAITGGRAVVRALPIRGELSYVQANPGGLRMRVVSPGTVWDVDYSTATGLAKVRTTAAGWAGVLNRIHQSQGLWHEEALLNAWAGTLGVVSLGLLTLGATGFYLSLQNHAGRWIGCILLAGGAGLAAALIVSMRYS